VATQPSVFIHDLRQGWVFLPPTTTDHHQSPPDTTDTPQICNKPIEIWKTQEVRNKNNQWKSFIKHSKHWCMASEFFLCFSSFPWQIQHCNQQTHLTSNTDSSFHMAFFRYMYCLDSLIGVHFIVFDSNWHYTSYFTFETILF